MTVVNSFTSESVTEGHPDKVADQISDAILDAYLEQDPCSRVAVETLVTHGVIVIAGEVTSRGRVDVVDVARQVLRDIGYTGQEKGFDAEKAKFVMDVERQSPDIAKGVDPGGAGDQGMMFGFAIDETPQLMPLPIVLAHGLTKRLAEVRKSGEIPYLGPDGKSQVTVEYEGERPVRVKTVLISAQHIEDVSQEQLKSDITEKVIKAVIPSEMLDERTEILVNPTGSFRIGGPAADTGLTGRKDIVDTYGAFARHGGGCLSGKDPTKVDRSGAYMMRYIAKNVVAAGLARKCEAYVAYAIGKAEPLDFQINTFGTGVVPDEKIRDAVLELVDLTPKGMIEHLKLLRPIYRKTACYGHFGRNDPDFTWEKTDLASALKERAGG